MITGSFGGLGNVDPKAFDFEERRWERFWEGEFSKAKEIMSSLDAEKVPNRLAIPDGTAPTRSTVVIEVMRRWLPQARELTGS